MKDLNSSDGSSKTKQAELLPEVLSVEKEAEIKPDKVISAGSGAKGNTWRVALDPILLIILLGGWGLVVMDRYFYLHRINPYTVLFEGEPLPVLKFVTTDKTLSIAIEIFAWAGTAVIVRRIVRVVRAAKSGHIKLRQDLLDFVADYSETIYLTNMLMALLRMPTITLGSGINISLNEASIDVVITFASVLGWSVRETRLLLTRILRILLRGQGAQTTGGDKVETIH